ncbi:hypothetical protein KFE25_003379 [Diacronema lutheri]|uniref:Uncharacterized protein n=2 Tax=Diacronema lutheri TaxID=2081491 RepID=A0A8J6CAQ0_DIALT|nr:hypothetical protein KFE25_003379 [Diacronema lutheri]
MALARGSATGLLRRLGWRLSSQEIPPRPQGLSKRGRNLFELAALLPKGGLGVRFVRKSWLRNGYDDSHWTVERIRFEPDGRHGDAWGTFTFKGEVKKAMGRVRGAQKRDWRYVPAAQ